MSIQEYLSIYLYDTAIFIVLLAVISVIYGAIWMIQKVRGLYGKAKAR